MARFQKASFGLVKLLPSPPLAALGCYFALSDMGFSQTFVLITLAILTAVLFANLALRLSWGRFALSLSPLFFATLFLLVAIQSPRASVAYFLVVLLGTALVASIALPPVRSALARFVPIDPTHPLHTAALALAVALILNHFGFYLAQQSAAPSASSAVLWQDQLTNFALMVGLALLGVGALTRRSWRTIWPRLGLKRPNRFQIFFAIGLGSAFQLVALLSYAASHLLTPALAQKVDQNSNALLDPILSTFFFFIPVGIIFLAASAALGEELLFRGALQPRLGLLLAALLFTAFHDQYGFSFDLLSIFLLALALGWLRSSMNLWACIAAHFWYDFSTSFGLDVRLVLLLGASGLALCLLLLHSNSAKLFMHDDADGAIRWHQV